jgi:hypothetical protein
MLPREGDPMTRALLIGAERSGRGRRARRVLSLCTALAAGALAAGPAAAIGPGLVSTTGADAGERLNVDGTNPFTMFPGTYEVTNFTYNSTGVGEVIPFLVTPITNDEYQLLWIGSRLAFGAPGETVSVDPVGHFTLRSPGPFNIVLAGFYTTSGGRVAFLDGGNTDHNATVVPPRGGVPIGNFATPTSPGPTPSASRPGCPPRPTSARGSCPTRAPTPAPDSTLIRPTPAPSRPATTTSPTSRSTAPRSPTSRPAAA